MYIFKVSTSAIRLIIKEVSESIVYVLGNEFIKTPKSSNEWLQLASEFNRINLGHCVGLVDGKHFRIKKPSNAGSRYYNFKSFHSIILLAIVDANYNFIFIDVGKEGSMHDSQVYDLCVFKKQLDNNALRFHKHATYDNLPLYLIGDGGFRLSNHFMVPYKANQINTAKDRKFNQRISSVRRLFENVFGILVSRFRLFKRTINVKPDVAKHLIASACILNNFLNSRRHQILRSRNANWVFKISKDHLNESPNNLRKRFALYYSN